MSPSPVAEGGTRGYIIPIGGAEKKMRDPDILRRFVDLCGGHEARIAIVPTASELKETGRRYEKVFGELGAGEARAYPFMSRGDCERDELLADFEGATGVFLTGGNQLRLSTTVGGTAVAQAIRRLNAAGVPVAGTSAGAGFLSEHMIAFGDEGFSPRANIVTLAPGLGLTNRVVVDHHFRQRERLGRLLTAIGYNPFVIGVGLDEDTAAFIDPEDRLEVVGTGGLTIADGHELEFSSMDSARQDDPVCLVGLKIHVLVAGWTFDIATRTAAEPANISRG